MGHLKIRIGLVAFWSALLCALCIAVAPEEGLAQPRGVSAFVGARLIDGRGGTPVENATVIVRDGVITAVGAGGKVEVPGDARIIRLAGKTLMPGLIDAHVHMGMSGGSAVDDREFKAVAATKNLRSYIVFGVTTVFDLGGNPFIQGLKEALAAERMIGPRLFGVKQAITSPDSHPLGLLRDLRFDKLLGAAHPTVQTTEEARYLVSRLASERADGIKIFHTRSEFPGTMRLGTAGNKFEPSVLKALVSAAQRQKLRTFVHVSLPQEAREAMVAGADVIAGGIGRGEAGADETFKMMARRGATYIPTLAQLEAIVTGGAGVKATQTLRGKVWSVVLRSVADPHGLVQKRRQAKSFVAVARRHFEMARANLKRAVAAGVRIAMGTGAGNPGVMHGASAPRELELMTGSGMTPMQAIVAATANAAEAIGQASKIGTIEPDKLADMIVVSGDPLADVSAVRNIDLVVRGGYAFDPAGIRID